MGCIAAHDRAHRKGMQLQKLKDEVVKEHEERGEGLSFTDFVAQSHSFLVDRYRDKAEEMMIAMGNLQEVTAKCASTDAMLKKEIVELQAEFEDTAMHCRRLTAQEMSMLDVRVAMELDGGDHTNVVVPFRSADELCHSRWTPHFEADGRLESYVNNSCFAFVGISCDVHAIQIAGCLTLLHNPCLPPRLGPGTMRLGRCLRILFLADNNLGAYNLRLILKGLQNSKDLEVFHCHSNGVGELGEGSSQQSPDQDPTDALSAMDELAEIVENRDCPLRVLGLSKNRIGAAGLSRLMPGIALNSSIVILDLSENCLGVSGANHIAKCLVKNRSLQTLNVNNTMLTHYGLRAICSALQFNPTLRILYTLRNVGPAARQDIFKSMEENTTLEVMHVFVDTPWINPNFLGPESAVEIARFDEVAGGVPFANRVALIRAFKSFDQVANATEGAMNAMPGMTVATTSAIYYHFHSSDSQSRKQTATSRSDTGTASGTGRHEASVAGLDGTLSADAALALLEDRGYYQEVEDPWNVEGCLRDEEQCTWEPVATESFRLEFSKARPATSQSADTFQTESSMTIPTPDRHTPDRPLTQESDALDRPSSRQSDAQSFGRAGSSFGRTGSSRGSGKPSGASQVEERLRAAEQKRRATKGVSVFWANQAMKPVDLSAKPVAQSWGPPREAGVNIITSKQILGAGANHTVDKKHLRCSYCAKMGPDGRAGVGEYGHEDFECPVNFFKTTGELLPGFTQFGSKDEELWEVSMAETKPEVRALWKQLVARGFFQEPADGIPITERKIAMHDVSRAGKQRRTWEERGGFTSKDAMLRKEMFESTRRSGEALFTHGTEQLNAFLRERSQSGLSDEGPRRQLQRQETVHLVGLDEMSIERRKHLHTPVEVESHDGIKFIPSAHKRVELFLQKIRNNHVEEVKEFLDGTYGKIDANDKDARTGCTALIEAAQSGHKRILKLLMKAKASVNAQDRKGNTALHYASAYKYQAVVDYLVQHGADLEIRNAKAKSCLEGI